MTDKKNEMVSIIPANPTESALAKYIDKKKDMLIKNMMFPIKSEAKQDAYFAELIKNIAVESEKSQYLQKCFSTNLGKISISNAIENCAKYGVMIGGTLPQAYLMPMKEKYFIDGKDVEVWVAKFQMTAEAYISACKQTGIIKECLYYLSYTNKYFQCNEATGEVNQVTFPDKDCNFENGGLVGVVVKAILSSGEIIARNFDKNFIEKIRNNSMMYRAAKDKTNTTWEKHKEAKWAITAVRSLLKPRLREAEASSRASELFADDIEVSEPIVNAADDKTFDEKIDDSINIPEAEVDKVVEATVETPSEPEVETEVEPDTTETEKTTAKDLM